MRTAYALLLALTAALSGAKAVRAETTKPPIPELFDLAARPIKPDLGQIKTIRFLTTDDFPPFHFALPDGTLAGYDIDLARAICADLQAACTIQARRFDTLVAQIKAKTDDALIAAVANTPASRADLAFTAPYYTTPARFVTAKDAKIDTPSPDKLAGVKVGVITRTAHEAYLRAFFSKADIKAYPDRGAARAALRKGEVVAIFDDGISLALWLNGTESAGCCAFRGGPYTESRFFGNGVSIAVGKDNEALRRVLDYELAHLARTSLYADLYLKYFPIGFY